MQLDIDEVNKSGNGWNVRLKANLSNDEVQRLNNNSINMVDDFHIELKDSNLYFDCFLNNDEPWEDEPLEELLKAIKIEVEYHVKALLK